MLFTKQTHLNSNTGCSIHDTLLFTSRDSLEKHLLASHPNLPAWMVHMHENESTMYVDEVPTDDSETVLGKQKKKLKSKLLGPKTKRHQRLMAEYKEWHAQGKPGEDFLTSEFSLVTASSSMSQLPGHQLVSL